MFNLKIDMTRYLALVEKEKKFKNQGKSFETEDNKDYSELVEYRGILHQQWRYEQRQKYIELIKNYIEKKLSSDSFRISFYQMWYRKRDESALLEQNFKSKIVSTILIDSKAKRFSELINSIFSSCEALIDGFIIEALTDDYPLEDLTDPNAINEDQFQDEITEIFIKMQNLFNEE